MIVTGGGLRGGPMRFGCICGLCEEGRNSNGADASAQPAGGHNPDDVFHGNLLWRSLSYATD